MVFKIKNESFLNKNCDQETGMLMEISKLPG